MTGIPPEQNESTPSGSPGGGGWHLMANARNGKVRGITFGAYLTARWLPSESGFGGWR